MDTWIWVLVVAVPLLLIAIWIVLIETSVMVPPGTVALLLRRGKATGRALEPGRRFVRPWRPVMVEVYPSRELALVAGGPVAGDPRVDFADEPVRVHLGDRAAARISYTLRCQLDRDKLRDVHNRFGPEGVWSAIRDTTRSCIVSEIGDRNLSVDDAFGERFAALEDRLTEALASELAEVGFELTAFGLREIDLGDTGAVIQATVRARAELDRERAFADVRRLRIENDVAMRELLANVDDDLLLRYRQLEAWRDVLQHWDGITPIPAAITVPLNAGTTPMHLEESPAFAPEGDTTSDSSDEVA